MSDKLQAALSYGAQGFRVLPCHSIEPEYSVNGTGPVCTCGRPTCLAKKQGKHPRIVKWQLNATTDPSQISKWWNQRGWHDANIGVLGGELVFIDVDLYVPETAELFAKLEAEYGELSREWSVKTGGGGLHIWLRLPSGVLVGSVNGWRNGIDIKSTGGYALAPPSHHKSGNEYSWLAKGKSIRDVPLIVPKWLEVLPVSKQDSDSASTKVQSSSVTSRVGASSTDSTDTPDKTNNYSVVSELSGLSVQPETKAAIWGAINYTLPSAEGIRNSCLVKLGRWLLRIEEISDWYAEDFEPIIRLWFRLAVETIGPREWSETWAEWLYIWGVWLDRSGKYETVKQAFELAMSKPFPPMPSTYKSKHLCQVVALCAAMQETNADENGVWFIGTRDVATVIGLVDLRDGVWIPQHELVAAFLRQLVRDGIIVRICHHCGGVNTIRTVIQDDKKKRVCTGCNRSLTRSPKAQRFKYLGYKPAESTVAA